MFDDIEDAIIDSDGAWKGYLLWGMTGVLVVACLGGIAHGINMVAVSSKYTKHEAAIEQQRAKFGQEIAKKFGLKDFDVASCEVATDDNQTYIKAFGSIKEETLPGVYENKYVNITFKIPSSETYKIIDALQELQEIEALQDRGAPENGFHLDKEKIHYGRFSENRKVLNASAAAQNVYDILGGTLSSATLLAVEDVYETSQFNNVISQLYRYTRPEVLDETKVNGLFTHGSTTFINAGVMVTGVSQVVNDQERGVSYFFVDTTQGREVDGRVVPVSCRLRVEVEGTGLSQEEVYQKFVAGEYKKVVDIVRTEDGEKTGVVNNKLEGNVEEIELF